MVRGLFEYDLWPAQRLGRTACAVAVGLSLSFAGAAAAEEGDQARSLVELYYILQTGQAGAPEQIAAGIPAAQALYDEGYSGVALVNLVTQAHRDIPGAKTQPFEFIMPPFAHGAAVPGASQQPSTSESAVGTDNARSPAHDLSAASTIGTRQLPAWKPYQRTMTASIIIDLVGYLAWTIGAIVSIQTPGGYIAMGVGGSLAAIGSLVGTIGISSFHGQVRRAGALVRTPHAAGGWILTSLTLVSAICTWVVPLGIVGGIAFSSVAVILEIINMAAVRSKWEKAIHSAPSSSAAAKAPALRVSPYLSWVPGSASTGRGFPMVGVAGSF